MIQDDNMKKCTCCQEILDINFFGTQGKRNRRDSNCKKCRNQKRKIYNKNNKEKRSATRKAYYQKNLNKMRQEKIRYGKKNKLRKREYDLIYRAKKRESIKKYKQEWELKHRNDKILKIKRNLRRRVAHVLKGRSKADKTFNLIGCTPEFFIKYIESLWADGMSWENYGPKGWHVDHIIPCYSFDLSQEEEQRRCFHYTNQRPLWAWQNLSRSRNNFTIEPPSYALPNTDQSLSLSSVNISSPLANV